MFETRLPKYLLGAPTNGHNLLELLGERCIKQIAKFLKYDSNHRRIHW